MGIRITLDDVTEMGERVWATRIAPHEVSGRFGGSGRSVGNRTVMLVTGGRFDGIATELSFEATDAQVLNLGTSEDTIIIGFEPNPPPTAPTAPVAPGGTLSGPGDTRFLAMIHSHMRSEVAEAGVLLLEAVRQRFPGDLQQLESKPRKFVEAHDNFWTVKLQPRDQSYYITLRGKPHMYQDSSFEIKSEMGSYSRFYLRRSSEVPEAIRLLSKAKGLGSLARL